MNNGLVRSNKKIFLYIKLMVKYFYIAFIGVVLLGYKRPDHELSFDIQKQVIVNCNNNQLNKLSI